MLLLEVEKHAQKLSLSDKEQLIRDVQTWLNEEKSSTQTGSPAPGITDIAGEYGGWKLHPDFNFDEMYETGKNLRAFLDTRTGPDTLDESRLMAFEGDEQ